LHWKILQEKHGLTEERLAKYGSQGADKKASNQTGLAPSNFVGPSVRAAEERFRALDAECWPRWYSSGADHESYAGQLGDIQREVLANVGSFWKGRSVTTDIWH